MGKDRPPQQVISDLKNRVKRLQRTVDDQAAEIRYLKNQVAFTVQIAGPDPRARNQAVDTIRRYLEAVHTVSLISDANQAIRYDTPRVAGGGNPPAPSNPQAVWAANFLEIEIDSIAARLEHVDSFIHRPYRIDTPDPRSRRNRRCTNCQLPHCHKEAS